jgi:hypothetical protein
MRQQIVLWTPWLDPPLIHHCLLHLQEGIVYDFTFDVASCGWQHWRATAGPAAIPEDAAFNDIIVQTVDTLRYSSLLRLLVQSGKHVMLAGPTGRSQTGRHRASHSVLSDVCKQT